MASVNSIDPFKPWEQFYYFPLIPIIQKPGLVNGAKRLRINKLKPLLEVIHNTFTWDHQFLDYTANRLKIQPKKK